MFGTFDKQNMLYVQMGTDYSCIIFANNYQTFHLELVILLTILLIDQSRPVLNLINFLFNFNQIR